MAHGKSLELRKIGPADPTWVHEHTTPTTAMRRANVLIEIDGNKVRAREVPGRCKPYVNPDRDHRMGRKNKPPQEKPQQQKGTKGGRFGTRGGKKG